MKRLFRRSLIKTFTVCPIAFCSFEVIYLCFKHFRLGNAKRKLILEHRILSDENSHLLSQKSNTIP